MEKTKGYYIYILLFYFYQNKKYYMTRESISWPGTIYKLNGDNLYWFICTKVWSDSKELLLICKNFSLKVS